MNADSSCSICFDCITNYNEKIEFDCSHTVCVNCFPYIALDRFAHNKFILDSFLLDAENQPQLCPICPKGKFNGEYIEIMEKFIKTPPIDVNKSMTVPICVFCGIFPGTFYYPVRGSGLFLPLGKTLIAYNKIHAMKLLGAANEEILKHCGKDFHYFLKKDSKSAAYSEEPFFRECVVNKRGTENSPSCNKIYNYFTKVVYYKKRALDNLIEEMVSGKCLRYDTRSFRNDMAPKYTLVYYGCSDTGDKFLSQLARNRGYDTVQLLREAQMASNEEDAVVGSEVIHLVEGLSSQASLLRLDPFKIHYYMSFRNSDKFHINYLLDKNVTQVDAKAVIAKEFIPFEESTFEINLIVEERN